VNSLILYTTLGCHLCEQAEQLIEPLLVPGQSVSLVDISESDELMDRYGIRIPVVSRPDNDSEIGWPFNEKQFLEFLQA